MRNDVEFLKTMLVEIRGSVDESTAKKLELDKCERLVERLSSFSEGCKDCAGTFLEFKEHFVFLQGSLNQLQPDTLKKHKEYIRKITVHLQKEHKLVTEGTYLSIYMSLGLTLGIAFGLSIFDNIALGMPIGMSIGLAIGAGLDADAKKKGKMI